MALLKYLRWERPVCKVSANLASDPNAKDRPSRGPYMKLSPEQIDQVARYTIESRNKRAIAKLSSSEASISRKMQSGRGSRNTRKYCESDGSAVNTKCGQVVHCSLGKLELDHRLDKGSRIFMGSRHPPKTRNF